MDLFNDPWLQYWLADQFRELEYYFRHLTRTHWGIVSAASVLFGLLCLRGLPVRD